MPINSRTDKNCDIFCDRILHSIKKKHQQLLKKESTVTLNNMDEWNQSNDELKRPDTKGYILLYSIGFHFYDIKECA